MEMVTPYQTQEAEMDKLHSRVPDLLTEKEWDMKRFIGLCIMEGLSEYTARRIAEGETRMTTETLVKVAIVLDAEIGDILILNQQP
jgi:DNA-binding Xre family transcriptional regulator